MPAAATSDPPAAPVRVHKFGGSSLADAACMRRVAAIVRAQPASTTLVVVSAMRGTTDALIALADAAMQAAPDWPAQLQRLRERHRDCARELLDAGAGDCLDWLDGQFAELHDLLAALAVLRTPNREASERVQGLGEVWSSYLLAELLRAQGLPCARLDAREVLVVGHGELGANVEWADSQRRFDAWRAQAAQPWVVVTGFVARSVEGRATVLGRNGSDYSAAIFARLAGASELTLWGDTDGVLSADPRLVPEAVSLPRLSYSEACELAYFGAKVIHPQTLTPAIAAGMAVRIRNTFAPEQAGTAIGAPAAADGQSPVKGLSAVQALAVLTLEGAGMIGVPGTAERAFGALHAAGVSVVMISQGSSEHSICCIVREADLDRGRAALERAFEGELARGTIARIAGDRGISVLAAVGDGMAGQPGVAARLFSALARSGVNIRAIAQGASERNISVAVASGDAARALRSAHAAFWLSPQTISIGLIGPGKVGQALLGQLLAARERLLREHQLDLRVRAVASRSRMWCGESRLAAQWRESAQAGSDLDAFTAHVHAEHLPHALIIDCSASDAVAERYAAWLAAGIHVVTPNKHAGAGPRARWQGIRAACASGARFRYEATVGAGLPVISTLRDLLDTGDELHAVQGILSGTLAWLFNRYDGSVPFSALVREAHARAYTEPDPRDDLSGTDVARKLVILAREAGVGLELADVEVESLVPASLRATDAATFIDRLGEFDALIETRHASARRNGCVLRYVAQLDRGGQARVGLVELPTDHAFAHLRLTDNIVQFTTRRYADNPLVVQGPGAGPEVTAAGVFADILRIVQS
ncbi:MAG: bifunctional aspartate kinase/homoserine dehydrogenase I [Xanthomonadales bacterium]|nr:bifunctional aspartate kinase/homoserine dehydrogenase I [Xanthomonadales bacterium]MDL1868520.1 bifunctional aspartate kinase/homoserine dehydrogenase I [Gammaproteobacteria bacterium PRO6]